MEKGDDQGEERGIGSLQLKICPKTVPLQNVRSISLTVWKKGCIQEPIFGTLFIICVLVQGYNCRMLFLGYNFCIPSYQEQKVDYFFESSIFHLIFDRSAISFCVWIGP